MSIAASNGVWTRSKARTPAELLVLLAMADWADEDGVCYPSYAGVAKRARLSERQVIRVIAKFVASGELDKQVGAHRTEVRGHRRGKTGLQPRNQYRFSDRILGHEEGVTERGDIHDTADSRGDNGDAKGVTPEAGRGDIHAAHIRNEPLVDPLVDPSERAPARLAFKGSRFSVPKFLHEQFTDQLGPKGLARFDLLLWYYELDKRDDGPIAGDVLTFIRQAFAEETKRRFGTRTVGAPLRYADWTCPHTPQHFARHECHIHSEIERARQVNA